MLAAALVCGGCSKKVDEAQQAAEAAVKAAQQMAQSATNNAAAGANGAAANHTPGVAIPAKTLVAALVTPSGYTIQGEPESMEMEMQGNKYSHANAVYKNGDKQIQISIMDYNYIAGLSAAYSMFTTMNMETNDESIHSDKFAGFPGWTDWKKKQNEGSVGVVVNDRVFVVTEGSNGATMDEIKAAANGVNYSAIAAAAK